MGFLVVSTQGVGSVAAAAQGAKKGSVGQEAGAGAMVFSHPRDDS